jgi:hypothetical protein
VRKDGFTLSVSARWVDPIGYLDDTAHARHRGFYDTARDLAPESGTIVAAPSLEHQGRTVHVVRSLGGEVEWETAIILRGPVVYTIVAWNTGEPKAERIIDGIMDRLILD